MAKDTKPDHEATPKRTKLGPFTLPAGHEPDPAPAMREISGPCKVLGATGPMDATRSVLLPCGLTVRSGETFDPVAEGLSKERYTQLVAGGYITPAPPEYTTKLLTAVELRKKALGAQG